MKTFNLMLMLCVLSLPCIAGAQGAPPLTVVVVIDQLPLYLIDNNLDLFGNDGFRRLEREGVLYSECRYSHAVLETGPGHATIATGCNPSHHGIVSNGWRLADGGDVYCVACADARAVTESGVSDTIPSCCPDKLDVDGLSDAWRKTFGDEAKIWSMSLKDRAAITMGGRNPDGAVWLNFDTGKFESSSYYSSVLPAWCVKHNQTFGAYFDKTWDRAVKLEYYSRCDTDNAWYEDGTKAGLPNTLPKSMRGGDSEPGKGYLRALETSPFGNDYLYGLVKECIAQEKLGKDKTPDLLWVSFSSNDMCGHTFGPQSHEMLDMMIRTDKMLADLLSTLELKLGKGNFWLALTADHGVCPACESSLVPSGMGGRFSLSKMKNELNDHLAQRFTKGVLPKGGFISAFELPTIYMHQKNIHDAGADLAAIAEAATKWISAQPGVRDAVATMTEEDVAAISDAKLRSHIENSFHEERFADIYLHPQPYWQSDGITANHGVIHDYDTHVPLYFFGKPFGSGRDTSAADPMDLATTIGAAAEVSWEVVRDGQAHLKSTP